MYRLYMGNCTLFSCQVNPKDSKNSASIRLYHMARSGKINKFPVTALNKILVESKAIGGLRGYSDKLYKSERLSLCF